MDAIDRLKYEKELLAKGYRYIAGVDEVGRGPLAGPVTVCAVIMPLNQEDIIEGVNDSKKLSARRREQLCPLIMSKAIACKVVSLPHDYIDEVNILNATKEAMRRALKSLEVKPDIAIIDAVKLDADCEVFPLIKGDLLSYSVGCASIVAKVTRDALMDEYALEYPQYGFDKNKGYGTKVHIDALKEYGATPIHRRSFITRII
ncbi:MAG: ribonuclease HII [Clostridia bacterium]|nr:ribonuclease HII [Clostridia bacterium]